MYHKYCLYVILIFLFISNSLAFDFFNMFNGPGEETFQREERVKKGKLSNGE